MARVRILAIKNNEKYINLLTTIIDFENKNPNSKLKKIMEFKDNDLFLFEGFISKKQIVQFKQEILNNKIYKIDNYVINFELNDIERKSFLYPYNDYSNKKHLYSPFKSISTLREYWCLSDNIKRIWNCTLETDIKKLISKYLEINLYEMIDRVGNLLHFQEKNEIGISIIHQNDTTITFSTSMDDKFVNNKYFATLQVKSFDDIILKKGFYINERFIDFELQDEDYEIEIEVYNTENNECVFKNTFTFVKEISLNLNIAGPKLKFVDQNNTDIYTIQTYSTENIDTYSEEKHSKCIQYELQRNSWTNKISKFEELSFKGFSRHEFKDVFRYFQKLLKMISNCKSNYFYIADPYFLDSEFGVSRFIKYIEIFSTVQDKEIRVLTSSDVFPKKLTKFKENNKNKIFKNVIIKSISEFNTKTNRAFHDRWIASDSLEYGFTNSLNNFNKGVSFFKSFEHYYNQSEMLWNIKEDNDAFLIKEFKLYE